LIKFNLDVKDNLNSESGHEFHWPRNGTSGVILKRGILTIGRPISEIESNMEHTNIRDKWREKWASGLIAGIAPTLGFIGTIGGVIKIFL
jgi:biopolymer transport protein ExbB